MVLERLLEAKYTRKEPLLIFFFSIMITTISVFISYTVFKESTGLFTIVIISLIMVPFMNSMLMEEEIETEKTGEMEPFLQRHGDVISAYVALFAGMTLAMCIAFVILPEDIVQHIFDEQIKEVNIIRGRFTFGNQLLDILSNNISVLLLSFLFSFLLGTGAIFVLAWNASVLSAAMGLIAKSFGGVGGIPVAVMTFFPHGSFELTAYFIGAIAGGLVSAAITRKRSYKFWFVIGDSIKLLFISVLLLIIGAVIETAIILV